MSAARRLATRSQAGDADGNATTAMRAPAIGLIMVSLAVLSGCASNPNLGELITSPASAGRRDGHLLQIAADFEARGDTTSALALYQSAAATPADKYIANVRLGDAYTRTGNYKRAAEAYRSALAAEPGSGEALLGLGTALIRTNDIDGGLAALGKAAPIVDTGIAYNRLGLAQTLAGRIHEAIASFGRAVTRDPDDPDIRSNLALAAALDGRTDMAVALAQEAVGSPKAEPRHRRNLVIVLGMCKRAGDARGAVVADIPASDVQALLVRAGAIRAMKDVKARAKALGTIMG